MLLKKLSYLVVFLLLLCLGYSCSDKIIPPLQDEPEFIYTNSWKRLENYPIKREEQLYSQRGQGSKLAMYPETDTKFFYAFNLDVTIEFFVDERGVVTHSETFQDGALTKAMKVD